MEKPNSQYTSVQPYVRLYTDAIHCNDKAIGMILNVIEPDQFEHIDDKETAKEAWDALKQKHADLHTGLAAFYIQVGMLNKKYADGESMYAHLSFFSTENRKLTTKAFDDEFLMQITGTSVGWINPYQYLQVSMD